MQGHLQFQNLFGESLERQQIGPPAFGMTSLAQSFQQTLLAGAKPSGAPGEMSLLQRDASQAPADRTPKESPGNRVR